MQNKLFFVALILVAVFSFLAGKYFTHSKKSSEYIDALVTTVNLSSDRWNEIKLLTVLYEASLQDKETAKFQYVLAVSLMFRDDIRLRDIYKNDYGLNTGTYSTNNAVIESLKKHGFAEVKEWMQVRGPYSQPSENNAGHTNIQRATQTPNGPQILPDALTLPPLNLCSGRGA